MERHPEEEVEKEQLADDVDQIEALDERVGDDEVIAAVTTTPAADGARQTALDTQRTPGFALLHVVTLQVPDEPINQSINRSTVACSAKAGLHRQTNTKNHSHCKLFKLFKCLQCFDAVGWVAGRASGL